MKVKMNVFFNDTKGHNFEPEQVVEVGAEFGKWLIESRKAEEVSAPASRHDVEPQFENAEEPPKPETVIPPVKRRKSGRGAK